MAPNDKLLKVFFSFVMAFFCNRENLIAKRVGICQLINSLKVALKLKGGKSWVALQLVLYASSCIALNLLS